jgi:tRNA pseudouridine55 synthase
MGFAGTLDPLATGLMIIGTNGSPRLFPMIEHFTKTYTATIRLDGTTDSYDLEQPITPVKIPKSLIKTLSKECIEKIIDENFLGTISQAPPNYSAVWIDGQRAYELARKGEEIKMKSKERIVEKFEILTYSWPYVETKITVSHGTYIRSLARDLGEKL